jgi:hypothetical protein
MVRGPLSPLLTPCMYQIFDVMAKIGRSVLAVAVLAITASWSWPGGDPSGTAGKALPPRRRALVSHGMAMPTVSGGWGIQFCGRRVINATD